MKTHGGRSFLHGHLFGDNVHEYLAPCIYEGEGEMLGMAFFKSLVKQHGDDVLRADRQGPARRGHQEAQHGQPGPPVGPARAAGGVRQVVRRAEVPPRGRTTLPPMPETLPQARRVRRQAGWAARGWKSAARCASTSLALADRQCRMSELSQRVQDAVIMLCTALYAARQNDDRRGGGRLLVPGPDAQAHRASVPRTATTARSPSWARRSPRASSSRSPACPRAKS